MRIPARQLIIDRASDVRSDAVARKDLATVKGIDTLIKNLYNGMKLRWDADGALIVRSCNTPGAVYAVTAQRCSCPAHKPCVHMRLHELLLDMQATAAESADMEEDGPIIHLALERPVYRCRCGEQSETPGDCYGCLSRGNAYPMGRRIADARARLYVEVA
jgi:hypothetical protein